MNKLVTRPLKAFLCHASGDKPPVRELYKRLVFEGVDAWLDKEKLLPGQDWRVEIPRAVKEADVVIVFLSKKSVSKEGYVQKEIKFALDVAEEKPEGTIFLIPARLEECVVPERLSRWQWVDLYEENGFVQLLRSLKLRANAVGATIEPTSYEDSDKEIERRIKQLYTEGLAAFYTEDWDRACQRFQTILREHPNHKNAAEKMTEAERQRSLAKLYAQSTEAIRSENWQAALNTLEELSQKSADYKDVMALLKNVRKQKQLKELYAEVKTLYDAQKWEAVLKVFEKISALEPAYPDPDGLMPSAQKEVAEIKRLADLNDLYSNAVSEMDAGQWVEARRLLEQVHKAQTGFLETESLLRKVEDEIAKVEEHNKRNDQVNVLYEQAHGLVRTKKWRRVAEKLEEIKKLDEQFIDTDEIFTKARTELEREDRETQRQNELAAMYAEAVRLLQEEKYQEALDKWQEVKTVDPKYPDRQWVGRTARRKLAGTVQRKVEVQPQLATQKIETEWFILLATIGFGLARLVQLNLVSLVRVDVPNELAWGLRDMLQGLIAVLVIQRIISEWRWKALLTFAVCWAIVYPVTWRVSVELSMPFLFNILYSLAPLLSFIISSIWAGRRIQWSTYALIFAGWILAWAIGQSVANYLDPLLHGLSIRWVICDAIAGGIGLWITVDLLGTQSQVPSLENKFDIASKPVKNSGWLLLPSAFLGIIILRVIYGVFQSWFHVWDVPSPTILQFTFLFVLGGCYGVVAAFYFKKTIPNWEVQQSLTVIAFWAIGLGMAVLSGQVGLNFMAILMALCGLSVAVAIKWAQPSVSPLKIALIFVSWALVWKYGHMLGGYLQDIFVADYVWIVADGITILLGLVSTYGIYDRNSNKLTKRTILSVLGFAVIIITISIAANPTVYDDFYNPFYKDSFNKSLWKLEANDPRNVASQKNGVLTLVNFGYDNYIDLMSRKYTQKTLTSPTFIKSNFMQPPQQNGGTGIVVRISEIGAFVICYVWGGEGGQALTCEAVNFSAYEKISNIPIKPGSWHTAYIEVDPGVPTFTFYLDGMNVGSYTPTQTERYRSVQYNLFITSFCSGQGCTDQSSSSMVEGIFDYVEIGPLP